MLDRYFSMFQQELEYEESLATDVPGVFKLPLENGIDVTITQQPPGFHVYSSFGEVPNKQQGDFYMEMMQANLLGAGTGRASLGVDPDGRHLILSRVVETDVSYDEFKDIIDDFLIALDYWFNKSHTQKEEQKKKIR